MFAEAEYEFFFYLFQAEMFLSMFLIIKHFPENKTFMQLTCAFLMHYNLLYIFVHEVPLSVLSRL